jgi:hypothetical protein
LLSFPQDPVDLDTDAAKAALKTSLTANGGLTAASVALATPEVVTQEGTLQSGIVATIELPPKVLLAQ